MINPFAYFMNLSPRVKMTLIICGTITMCLFMYLAVETGIFDDIVCYFLTDGTEGKK